MNATKKCNGPNCKRIAAVKGLCGAHYAQMSLGRALSPIIPILRNGQLPQGEIVCIGPNCGRPARAKGLCNAHYQQSLRGTPPTPLRPKSTRQYIDWAAYHREEALARSGGFIHYAVTGELGVQSWACGMEGGTVEKTTKIRAVTCPICIKALPLLFEGQAKSALDNVERSIVQWRKCAANLDRAKHIASHDLSPAAAPKKTIAPKKKPRACVECETSITLKPWMQTFCTMKCFRRMVERQLHYRKYTGEFKPTNDAHLLWMIDSASDRVKWGWGIPDELPVLTAEAHRRGLV